MRVGFFNPYLRTLGGGEQVFLCALEHYVSEGADCIVFAPEPPQPETWSRLGIRLGANDFEWRRTDRKMLARASQGLDALLTMSNDFPPPSLAKRSVVVLQFPTRATTRPRDRLARSVAELIGYRDGMRSLSSYDAIACYSEFVRRHIQDRLGLESVVIYPPVPRLIDPVVPEMREAAILAVGRFFRGWHNKKHDVLIEAFRQLRARREPGLPDLSLYLAGSCANDAKSLAYLKSLKRLAADLPVMFEVNVSSERLSKLYDRCSLFWHATGFGEDENVHPERMEHFGITTVEAMSRGLIPLVIDSGAQPEIVVPGSGGYLWRTVEELVEQSLRLLTTTDSHGALRAAAQNRARAFTKQRFQREIDGLLTPGRAP